MAFCALPFPAMLLVSLALGDGEVGGEPAFPDTIWTYLAFTGAFWLWPVVSSAGVVWWNRRRDRLRQEAGRLIDSQP